MEEMSNKWVAKIEAFVEDWFFILLLIFFIRCIFSFDGFMLIIFYIINSVVSCYVDVLEIANTPLAYITINKIVMFICYCITALVGIICVYGIWSCLRDLIYGCQEE